jgi:hypothetical protein
MMQPSFAIRFFIALIALPKTATTTKAPYIKHVSLEFIKGICFILKEINLNVLKTFVYFVELNIRN